MLVIRAGQVGDTAYASSIIEPLRAHFGPDVAIDWLGKTGIVRLFARDPRVRHLFGVDSRRMPLAFNPGKLRVLAHALREPYDIAVNLELGDIFNGLMRLLPARRKVGMPYRFFAEPPETHAVDNLKLIYADFLPPEIVDTAAPSLRGTPAAEVRERLGLPENYLVLVPANSHLGRRRALNHRAWPPGHWRDLIHRLAGAGETAVLAGGTSDREFIAALGPFPDSVRNLAGQTDFPDLIGLIAGARAVVATDTGPAHIAGAVGTPVVVLIGPTHPARTAPYRTGTNRVTILRAGLPCSPCYHTPALAACTRNACMEAIAPEDIVRVLADSPPEKTMVR